MPNPQVHPRLSKAEFDHIHCDPPDQAGAKIPWLELHTAPSNLGVCDRQIYDRSDLVVLSLLDSKFSARQYHGLDLITIWFASVVIYVIAGRGQRWWRLVVVRADQARLVGQSPHGKRRC